MKKICVFLVCLFNAFIVFPQSSEDDQLKLRLLAFFEKIVSIDTTIDTLTESYGEPDLVITKRTGYLDDKLITYSYENIGDFDFFYKTDEKKTYFWSLMLNSKYINTNNIPTTMEGVDNYFNYKFHRRASQLNPGNIYLGYYGEFSINFIFRENDGKLYQIHWILH